MTTMICPSREKLSPFALGEVDEQFAFVSDHLTFCGECDCAAESDLAALGAQFVSPVPDGEIAAGAPEIAVMLQRPTALRKRTLAVVEASLILVLIAAGVIITIKREGEPDTQVEAPAGSRVAVDEHGNVAIELPGETEGAVGEQIQPQDQALPAELRVIPAGDGITVVDDSMAWIPLAPLVDADRDTRDANWTWDGETATFGSERPIARVAIPLLIDGSYELQTRMTIVQAKESTSIYLPVDEIGGKRDAVLQIRGDSGNTASTTATIRLEGMNPAPEPKRRATIDVGTEYLLSCTVAKSGNGVMIEVRLDEEVLYHWDGYVSDIAEVEPLFPGTVQLQTAYYTSSRFTGLRLRMLSGTATPFTFPPGRRGLNFY